MNNSICTLFDNILIDIHKFKSLHYKQLTATEVGNKGTHEIYIRMPNDFNSEDFFQAELESNNGVLEKKFKAKNLTKGHEDDDLIDLRFVHFAQSNNSQECPHRLFALQAP